MQISILVPTYQRPQQLQEALESLAQQDRTLIGEILVGDDSAPKVRAHNRAVIAASGLESLIRYLPNDPPKGNYPNQWSLGEQARCDHLLILHDDDQLCPHALARLASACEAETDPSVKVWFGRNLVMDENARVDLAQSQAHTQQYGKSGSDAVRPVWEWCLTHSLPPNCALFARATYQALMRGPRDGNVGDWGLAVRLANTGAQGRFIAEDLWRYRLQPDSVTGSQRGVDAHYMYEMAHELVVPPQRRADKKQLLLGFAEVATTRYLRDGERALAWKCFMSGNWRWWRRLSPRGVVTLFMLMTPPACWLWMMRHRG